MTMPATIDALLDGYRTGTLSPVAVAEEALARIDSWEPHINAFSQVQPAITLAAAAESARRWKQGTARALEGVPFSIKDAFAVEGYAFRRGSRVSSDAPASFDAPCVARVREAGAVPLGITTMPEFGAGPVTISPLTGLTRNPWDPRMGSGGSSGGAAASIAAGIGAFALATDSGGSIRIPAALNGAFGFKPSAGRVAAFPTSVTGSMSCAGPIVHCARDAARILDLIALPDPRDRETLPPETGAYLDVIETPPAKPRIGFSRKLAHARLVDPQIDTIVAHAVCGFERLGATIIEFEPDIPDPLPTYMTMLISGFGYGLRNLTSDQRAKLGPILAPLLDAAPRIGLADYLAASERRAELTRKVDELFDRFDYLVTPTIAALPFPAELQSPPEFARFDDPRAWVPFTGLFNLTGNPAASLRCGYSREFYPIGLQIIGRRRDDSGVLRLARGFETLGLVPIRAPALPEITKSGGEGT